jgi:hypothetical protein
MIASALPTQPASRTLGALLQFQKFNFEERRKRQ